jgi:glycosyltransferase involved in cell wall biosynthesis
VRILQVCKKFPYPLRDGEVIAIHQLTRGFYEAGHKVTVAAINTKKHFFSPDEMPQENQALADFHTVLLDTDVNWWDALTSLFRGDSYNIQRFVSADFERLLSGILKENEFDIVQLEGLYLLPYLLTIRKFSNAKIVLRAHNIEHLIWERNSKMAKPGAKKWYLQNLASRMKEFEIYNLNSCDALIPISTVDAAKFVELGCKLPLHTCPVGIPLDDMAEMDDPPTLCYLGSMDWAPNREGVEWFLDYVWPKVNSQFPELKFYVAGRNFPSDFPEKDYPQVEIVGEVENSRAFLRSKTMMVVPLFSGSGIRVKILEAMAEGRPVISSTIGAEGINAVDGAHLLIADTPDAFARQIRRLLKDKDEARRMGMHARAFIRENYDNRKLVSDLIDFYKTIMK